MTPVRLQHISRRFGSTVALEAVDLEVLPGELLFLLGPSGCGKSTLLRIVAGLLEPTTGRIFFGDRDVTNLSTEHRSAVMCFQNYALWPHMTVRENVRFGLSLGGDRNGPEQRVDEVLRLVQMDCYADRKPNSLSGGQQQRVALARAMAVRPKCLLLDEPLSNLDAKLRLEMRGEIRRICKTAQYTTIYVTHDQTEALSIADRIVVLKEGRIIQVGDPAELYDKPRTSFVADFLGQTNLVTGQIVRENPEGPSVQTSIGTLRGVIAPGAAVASVVSIRPEKIRILGPNAPRSPQANHIPATLIHTTFLGEMTQHELDVGGTRLTASSSPPRLNLRGEVLLEIDPGDCLVLPE
jgi:ABC-type Fe3+/spermidine/putrescine transport system ATPase subunit